VSEDTCKTVSVYPEVSLYQLGILIKRQYTGTNWCLFNRLWWITGRHRPEPSGPERRSGKRRMLHVQNVGPVLPSPHTPGVECRWL